MRALARDPAARGLEDDCAVLQVGGETLVLTHDVMAEGTHFRTDANLADVAWKLVAVNLSDLAAKGARPLGVLLGYSLGEGDALFVGGLREVLDTFAVPLLGGDTVRTEGPRSFGLTAIGRASHLPVPDRRRALPGQAVWTTGTFGRAMLGFEGDQRFAAAFNRPCPLLAEGVALAPQASAMMDVSDGLLLDCWRMAEASNVSIRLDAETIPVADVQRRDACIRWGDDYELLFTMPEGAMPPVSATRIGRVEPRVAAPLFLNELAFVSAEDLGYRH